MTNGTELKGRKSFLGITAPIFLWGIVAAFILAIVIGAVGYLVAVQKAPWPEDQLPSFNADLYEDGTVTYKDTETPQILSHAVLKSIVVAQLDAEAHANPGYAFDKILDAKYGSSIVIVESGNNSINEADRKWAAAADKLNASITALKDKIESAGYFDRQSMTDELEKAQRKQAVMESLDLYRKAAKASTPIIYPGRSIPAVFSYVIGRFKGVGLNTSGNVIFLLENPRPIVKASFLKKAGVSEAKIAAARLDQDADQLKSIAQEARARYNEENKAAKESIRESLREQRKRIREAFYERWFHCLGNLPGDILCIFHVAEVFRHHPEEKAPQEDDVRDLFCHKHNVDRVPLVGVDPHRRRAGDADRQHPSGHRHDGLAVV